MVFGYPTVTLNPIQIVVDYGSIHTAAHYVELCFGNLFKCVFSHALYFYLFFS